MSARRGHARRAGPQHLEETTARGACLRIDLDPHVLAGEDVRNEHRAALSIDRADRHAVTSMRRQLGDLGVEREEVGHGDFGPKRPTKGRRTKRDVRLSTDYFVHPNTA